MRIAYLDAFSGVSGDMTVGALLDLGVPLDAVRNAVAALGFAGVEVSCEQVMRGSLAAAKFGVHVHGEHIHEVGHGHGTERHADHAHRAWRDIRAQLAGSRLAEPVRERALAIFARLA